MAWIRRFLALVLILGMLGACSSTREESIRPLPTPAASGVKVRVMDVSNKTGELYEVDVIGMMWNALEESLNRRGMLWTPDSGVTPLTLEAAVTRYQAGSAWYRFILPYWGKTVLAARCELKEGGRVIASAEAKKTISLGSDVFTSGAWRKIFTAVAEDLVNELAPALRS